MVFKRALRIFLTLHLLCVNTILVVQDTVDLCVAGVGLDCHDLLGELLVEIDLASFDDTTVINRAVLSDGPVCVDLNVDVESSPNLTIVSKVSLASVRK